jgi:CheY-like chemotaxis protein
VTIVIDKTCILAPPQGGLHRRITEVTLKRIESLGYAVAEARTGLEALQRLQSKDPVELVLSDIVMPGGMSGYDVARWLASNKPEIKVILCSGYNEGDLRNDTQGAIRDIAVLGKPYTREQFAWALRNALAAVHHPEETSKYAPSIARPAGGLCCYAGRPIVEDHQENAVGDAVSLLAVIDAHFVRAGAGRGRVCSAALNAKSRRPNRSGRRLPR